MKIKGVDVVLEVARGNHNLEELCTKCKDNETDRMLKAKTIRGKKKMVNKARIKSRKWNKAAE
jgi:hypothetical protein